MKIIILNDVYQKMLTHSLSVLPEEACGYLYGDIIDDNQFITDIINITNIDHDPMHFMFDISEQFLAKKKIKKENKKLISIWHSHPNGPSRLTKEDIKFASLNQDISYCLISNIQNQIDLNFYVVNLNQAINIDYSIQ